jgi:hypothetical protein
LLTTGSSAACTTIAVARVSGGRGRSRSALQMPCHIADTTCPPPASRREHHRWCPHPQGTRPSSRSDPAYQGIGRRKPWIHIRLTRRIRGPCRRRPRELQPTSAQASAVSRTFSWKSSSCRRLGGRPTAAPCRRRVAQQVGVCSSRRPRRFAGSRSRHGCATSHVTSGGGPAPDQVVLEPGLQVQVVFVVVTEYAYTGTCDRTVPSPWGCGCVAAGDVRASFHGHAARSAPTSNNHSVSPARGQHHRGWPLPGMRNRLVHATAPSFLSTDSSGPSPRACQVRTGAPSLAFRLRLRLRLRDSRLSPSGA